MKFPGIIRITFGRHNSCKRWTTHHPACLAHHIRQPPRIALDDSRRSPSREMARVSPIPRRDVLRREINELRLKLDTDEMQAMLERVIAKAADAAKGIDHSHTWLDPPFGSHVRIDALGKREADLRRMRERLRHKLPAPPALVATFPFCQH